VGFNAAFHFHKNVTSPDTNTASKLVFIQLHRVAFVNLFILTVVDVGGISLQSGFLPSVSC